MTVRVDLSVRRAWEMVLPGQRERVKRETLDEARQMGIDEPVTEGPAS
jgi:hypothetical protein